MIRFERAPTTFNICAASLLSLAAGAVQAADEAPPSSKLTGHVDLVSRYYLRGATTTYGNGAPLGNVLADAPESDKPALQWGADYVHPSGFYVGYFGSQVNYSYQQLGRSYRDRSITAFQTDKSIENDFYAGYGGSIGGLGYNVGATYYYYVNGVAADAAETKLALSYGAFTLSAQTLLKDVVWGNRGDTYWSLLFTQPLPHDLTFTANLGFYSYEKEGKYLGTTDTLAGSACAAGEAFVVNGCYAGRGPSSGDFRHLILGLAQPIGDTGLTWGAQAILGGKTRFGVKQDHKMILSLSYGF